jgi:prepilin-type N-terminal cleavage/methylation domain-containing protein
MRQPQTFAKQAGFTLIELSIVLVIIGLIVGGVLVGQDLIKAAEIRATISQKEKIDAATMTFRGKYNGLPGDLLNASTTFGFDATGIAAGTTGNGLINRGAAGATDNSGTLLDDEAAMFFRHLAQANLIGDPITQSTGAAASVSTIATTAPLSKMGRGNYFLVMNISGLNAMFLGGFTVSTGTVTFAKAITPSEAFQIDSKVDDGNGLTGTVVNVTDFVTVDAGGTGASGDCMKTTGVYWTSSSTITNVSACVLKLRPSF